MFAIHDRTVEERELIKTKYVCLTVLFIPQSPPRESRRSLWELLTMLESFEGEPEEDDGVEEAVQTMGPEDLQNSRGRRMEEEERRGGGLEAAGDSKKRE